MNKKSSKNSSGKQLENNINIKKEVKMKKPVKQSYRRNNIPVNVGINGIQNSYSDENITPSENFETKVESDNIFDFDELSDEKYIPEAEECKICNDDLDEQSVESRESINMSKKQHSEKKLLNDPYLEVKMEKIKAIYEDIKLYNKLVANADYALRNINYALEGKDLVTDICTNLLEGANKWDVEKYDNAFMNVMQHINWKVMKLCGDNEISYLEKLYGYLINGDAIDAPEKKTKKRRQFISIDHVDESKIPFGNIEGDFDIKGIYQHLSPQELINHNKSLVIQDWLDNKASTQQKKIVELWQEGMSKKDITLKLNIPIKDVYNLTKNNKAKLQKTYNEEMERMNYI